MLCRSASISPVWSSGGDAGAPAGELGAPTPRLLQDRAVALSPQSLSWPHLITGHAQGADTVLSAPRVFNTSVLQNPVHGVSYPTSQTRMQGERAGRHTRRVPPAASEQGPPPPRLPPRSSAPPLLRVVWFSTALPRTFLHFPSFSPRLSPGAAVTKYHTLGDLAEDLVLHVLGAKPGGKGRAGQGLRQRLGDPSVLWHSSAGGRVAPISAFVTRGLLSMSPHDCPSFIRMPVIGLRGHLNH